MDQQMVQQIDGLDQQTTSKSRNGTLHNNGLITLFNKSERSNQKISG